MDRRTFLKTSTVAAAGSGVAGAATVQAGPVVAAPAIVSGIQDVSFAAQWSADVPVFGDMAARLSARLQQALGERYRILDEAEGMEPDLVFAIPDSIADPGSVLFAGLPGSLGLSPEHHQAWLSVGGGQMLWDDMAASPGWQPLLAGHTGINPGLWANRDVTSAADFAGTTVAAGGLAARVLQILGATTVALPPSQLGAALSADRIAAAEWGNPLAAMMVGLPQAATHLYAGGIQLSGSAIALEVRQERWEQFSSADRAVIEAIAAQSFALSVAEARAHERIAMDTISRVPSLKISSWPSTLAVEVERASLAVVDEIAAGSAHARRICDSVMAFRQLTGGTEAPETWTS